MEIRSPEFRQKSTEALGDVQLQRALGNVKRGFIAKRQKAIDNLPEFEHLRDRAREIKTHTLKHLDLYLEAYERKVAESGGHVHWAASAEDARETILAICQRAGARSVTKGKSMIAEEVALNPCRSGQYRGRGNRYG